MEQEECMVFSVGEDALWYETLEQGSDEWFVVRAGKVTASPVSSLLVKGKGEGGLGTGAITYLKEKVAEVLSGTVKHVSSPAMKWGHDHEDEAREFYEAMTGVEVEQVGFIEVHEYVGVSPDGLVGEDGMVEIKNPFNNEKILDYHLMTEGKEIPKDYYAQVQMQLWAADRKWCDFVVYDTRMKRPLCIKIIRIERDEEFISIMEGKISAFVKLLEEKIKFFQDMMN